MDTAPNLAGERLNILKEAEECGNVSAVCARHGISRTLFYQWKRRYEEDGLQGLEKRPPIARDHPLKTHDGIHHRVLQFALDYPDQSYRTLAQTLSLRGVHVSATTVRKLLRSAGLGSQAERTFALEKLYVAGRQRMTRRQIRFIEAANPSLRDLYLRPSAPGEVLLAGVVTRPLAGRTKSVRHIAVIDAFSGYATASSQLTEHLIDAHDAFAEAYWLFRHRGLVPRHLIVEDTPELAPISDTYCRLIGMTLAVSSRPIGSVERFERYLQGLGNEPRLDLKPNEEFQEWLQAYNATPQDSFPNFGRSAEAIVAEHTVSTKDAIIFD